MNALKVPSGQRGERKRERPHVHPVARPSAPLGKACSRSTARRRSSCRLRAPCGSGGWSPRESSRAQSAERKERDSVSYGHEETERTTRIRSGCGGRRGGSSNRRSQRGGGLFRPHRETSGRCLVAPSSARDRAAGGPGVQLQTGLRAHPPHLRADEPAGRGAPAGGQQDQPGSCSRRRSQGQASLTREPALAVAVRLVRDNENRRRRGDQGRPSEDAARSNGSLSDGRSPPAAGERSPMW